MVKKEDIKKGLREIGLKDGDTVIVHSSLSCFGEVEGGADTVVDAILEVIGDSGTLVVPTFNFDPGVFDPKETPSIVGAITEAVRKRPNSTRSLHPTHSVTAIGALADVITEGHEKTHPFGRGSALFKLLQANGKILQLGVSHTTNSMIHVAEEIANVPYLDRSRRVGVKSPRGKVVEKLVRRPGCSQGFDVIEPILQKKGAILETFIGGCKARLMRARDVVDAAIEVLATDPEGLLCERPNCEACAEARAVTLVKEMENEDKEIIKSFEEEDRTRRMMEKRMNGGRVDYFDGESYRSPN